MAGDLAAAFGEQRLTGCVDTFGREPGGHWCPADQGVDEARLA
jgi:hypothetical protein